MLFIDWKTSPSLMPYSIWILCGQPGPILVFCRTPSVPIRSCVEFRAICREQKKNNNIRRFNVKKQIPHLKLVLQGGTKICINGRTPKKIYVYLNSKNNIETIFTKIFHMNIQNEMNFTSHINYFKYIHWVFIIFMYVNISFWLLDDYWQFIWKIWTVFKYRLHSTVLFSYYFTV